MLTPYGRVDASKATIRRLPAASLGPSEKSSMTDALVTVAAYRDRYHVVSDLPVDGGADSDAQRNDRERALQAVRAAARSSRSQQDHQSLGRVHSLSTP